MKRLLFLPVVLLLLASKTTFAKFEVVSIRPVSMIKTTKTGLFFYGLKVALATLGATFAKVPHYARKKHPKALYVQAYFPESINFSKIMAEEEDNRITILDAEGKGVVAKLSCPKPCGETKHEKQQIFEDFIEGLNLEGEVLVGVPKPSYVPDGVDYEAIFAYSSFEPLWEKENKRPAKKKTDSGEAVTVTCQCLEKDIYFNDRTIVHGTGSNFAQAKANARLKCQVVFGHNDIIGSTVDEVRLRYCRRR